MGTNFNDSNFLNLLKFVYILINTKKFQKNVKFGLDACFIVEIMMNGSDQQFGLLNFEN